MSKHLFDWDDRLYANGCRQRYAAGTGIDHDTKSTVTGAAIGDYQDKQYPNRQYYCDQYGKVYYINAQKRAVYVD